MAMSPATLKSAMKSAILTKIATEVKPYYEGIADDHRLPDYDWDTYNNRYWGAVAEGIAETIIDHIQAYAQLVGTDSHGDTHDLMGIT